MKETMTNGSNYNPVYKTELNRLNIQAERAQGIDQKAFRYAISLLSKKTNLTGLDIGCSNGDLTISRFGKYREFDMVVGVDKSHEAINLAKSHESEIFKFQRIDLESEGFVQQIQSFVGGHQKYDVIFLGLVVHHLSDPENTILKVKQLLSKDGVIICRSPDDGAKLFYPDDDNRFKKIIDLSMSVPGSSDRFSARRLYGYFKAANLINNKMMYYTIDTIGMSKDEKLKLFEETFSYRVNHVEKEIEGGAHEYAEILEAMLREITLLKADFMRDDFFYCKQLFSLVGQNDGL